MQGSTAGCVASLAKTSDTRNLKHGEWFHTFVKIRRLVARLHAGVYGGVGGLPRKEERLPTGAPSASRSPGSAPATCGGKYMDNRMYTLDAQSIRQIETVWRTGPPSASQSPGPAPARLRSMLP